MNCVRFNAFFEKLMKVDGLTEGRKRFKGWATAPLFDYEVTPDEFKIRLKLGHDETTFGEGSILTGRTVDDEMAPLPFPVVRLHLLLRNQKGGRFEYNMILTRPPDGYWDMAIVRPAIDGHDAVLCVDGFKFAAGAAIGDAFIFGNKANAFLEYNGNGKSVIQGEAMKCASLAYAFALDSLAPTNHIVEVSPVREHKSVEWSKARTHYTLITHDHPANNKAVAHRANVASDPEKELTRMAHNRRAHYKILRHERYKYARGKRIFVRAAWVGPKEWKDEGGKQIYRILEPVDNSPIT